MDGILLSHGHKDHIGALDLAAQIGGPPVHATAPVARDLPAGLDVRTLPLSGQTRIVDIPLTTGRTGHAPGGVWLHLDTVDGGVLYTGDMCLESTLYANSGAPLPSHFATTSTFLQSEPDEVSWELAQINHYNTRPSEDYLGQARPRRRRDQKLEPRLELARANKSDQTDLTITWQAARCENDRRSPVGRRGTEAAA